VFPGTVSVGLAAADRGRLAGHGLIDPRRPYPLDPSLHDPHLRQKAPVPDAAPSRSGPL
jgi:hypothetical protein